MSFDIHLLPKYYKLMPTSQLHFLVTEYCQQQLIDAQITPPSYAEFKSWLDLLCQHLDVSLQVDLTLVDDTTMAHTNASCRSKPYATNTLAMRSDDHSGGDIIMCPLVITQQAINKPITGYWAFLFFHSNLHLLGYTHDEPHHAEQMATIESQLLQLLHYQRETFLD